jgi:hypothetical protein
VFWIEMIDDCPANFFAANGTTTSVPGFTLLYSAPAPLVDHTVFAIAAICRGDGRPFVTAEP